MTSSDIANYLLKSPPESPKNLAPLKKFLPTAYYAALAALFKESENEKEGKNAEQLAEEWFAGSGNEDPILVSLILLLWANLCEKRGKENQSLKLIQYSTDLISTHPCPALLVAFQAYVNFTSSSYWVGYLVARDACHRAMQLSPVGSWMWLRCTQEFQMFQAQSDEGYNLKKEPVGLMDHLDESGRYKLYSARIFGLTVSGKLTEAANYLAPAREVSESAHPRDTKAFALGRVLLHHMGTVLGHPNGIDESYESDLSSVQEKLGYSASGYFQTTQDLLAGEPEKALQSAKSYAASVGSIYLHFLRYDGYDLIRAELANGNGDAALSALSLRRKNNLKVWLDGFFVARAYSLSGRHPEAQQKFLSCCHYAKTHQMEGRLIFELALALDLPRATLLRWRQILDSAPPLPKAPKGRRSTFLQPLPSEQNPKGLKRIIGNSLPIQNVRRQILRLSPERATVLITGETGTGKELAARAIHEESDRSHAPFVSVNCGALSPSLLASELFGHSKGAFTGAVYENEGLFRAAGEGVIFLDEISELPLSMQSSLLRALDTGEITPVGSIRHKKIKCRVLAATNRDLLGEVKKGTFREDLLYRLSTFRVQMPPLRERLDDLEVLSQYFLMQNRLDGAMPTLPKTVLDQLRRHSWKGNVRELINIIENIRIMQSDPVQYKSVNLEGVLEPFSEEATTQDVQLSEPTLEPEQSQAPKAPSLERLSTQSLRSPLRRRQRLKQLFRDFGQLKCREVAELLNVSRPVVTSDMKALCSEGFIRKVTPNRSPNSHYYERSGKN